MSQEILEKLDELRVGQDALQAGVSAMQGDMRAMEKRLSSRIDKVEAKLEGIDTKLERDHALLMDLITGMNQSIELLADQHIGPPSAAHG